MMGNKTIFVWLTGLLWLAFCEGRALTKSQGYRGLDTYSIQRSLSKSKGKDGTVAPSAKSKGSGKDGKAGKAGKDGKDGKDGTKSPKSTKCSSTSTKSSKSSKSSSKGTCSPSSTFLPTMTPTRAPNDASGSSSEDATASRPPISSSPVSTPTATAPTPATVSVNIKTPAPTEMGDLELVHLPQYVVSYDIDENEMPLRNDYLEVQEVTDTFFSNFMLDLLAEPEETQLVEFETVLITSKFQSGQPVHLLFNSSGYFSPAATSIPSATSLESLLQTSLDDIAAYLATIKDLDSSNAFYTTTNVYFSDVSVMSTSATVQSTPTQDSSGSSSTVIAAAAAGFTLVVAGVVLWRRKYDGEVVYSVPEDDLCGKQIGGNCTVTGETYAGDTYDGTYDGNASKILCSNGQDAEETMNQTKNNDGISPNSDSRNYQDSASERGFGFQSLGGDSGSVETSSDRGEHSSSSFQILDPPSVSSLEEPTSRLTVAEIENSLNES
eukprot:Nitzschia sp. Nitz4//scaffold163_size50693//11610//13154//NITZ4_006984-RA/size50693-augustus-gene-0.5-mRNA-1//-1//CDS//3329538019//9130//frame0